LKSPTPSDLIPICKELAVVHSEAFNKFLTPEYRLMFLFANDAMLTHSYNINKINGTLPTTLDPNNVEPKKEEENILPQSI